MSSPFICLYLDEDVNVLIAKLLRARGYDVTTVRDSGKLGATDLEQLAYAIGQKRTLVTHSRADFEALAQEYFDSEQIHYGLIFAVRHPPQKIARRLLTILDQVTSDEMKNQVRYI